jgi:hypothetical protein
VSAAKTSSISQVINTRLTVDVWLLIPFEAPLPPPRISAHFRSIDESLSDIELVRRPMG